MGSPLTLKALTLRLLGLLWLVVLLFVSADEARALGVGDTQSVTAPNIRANHHKRYPFAAAAAKADVVTDGRSQEGSTQSFQSYVNVRQRCAGGFLNEINAITDVVKTAAAELKEAIAGRLQGGNLPAGESDCFKQQIDQLNEQLTAIDALNRGDLGEQLEQQKTLTQFNSNCPEIVASSGFQKLQAAQAALGALKGKLAALDIGTESLITDGHRCVFKDPFCVTRDPPIPDHFFYVQRPQTSTVSLSSQRDSEAVQSGLIKTFGLPLSDSQFQLIDRENKQRLLELMMDPERWMWKDTSTTHLQMGSFANAMGGAGEATFQGAFPSMTGFLINIANDDQSGLGNGKDNGTARAVQIVQRMYKFVFLPMAVLLLLPGALFTQIKGMVGSAIIGSDADASSPFEGFLRAVIAIFLIPATQLIVSYSIDVGNSLTFAIADPAKNWIKPDLLIAWAKEQTFQPPPSNVANGILPPAAGAPAGGAGKGQGGENNPGGGAEGGGGFAGNQSGFSGAGSNPAGFSGVGSNPGGFSGAGSNPGGFSGVGSNPGGFSGAVGSNPSGPGSFGGFFFNNGNNGKALGDLIKQIFGNLVNNGGQGAGGAGKSENQLEATVTQENQLFLSTALQLGFNTAGYLLTQSLIILTAYQLVLMCYLMLIGPIAACFFAWPAGVGELFRNVFGNWLNAVIVLSLWHFYWCVILAIMSQRLVFLAPNAGSALEMITYDCFLALLVYIPFHPFNFDPGDVAAELLQQAGK